MGAHGPPVGNAGANVVARFGKAVDQLLAVRIGVETGDVEMDQAFALASCPLWQRLTVETQELALLVALRGNDRVGDQRDFDALLGEFRHGRIEQEGHVVVENFENGNLAPIWHHRIDHADIGTARRAPLHVFPGLFRQEGQGSGIVVGKVLDIAVVEQKLGKGPGRLARLHASRCLADQGRPSFVVTPGHNVLRLWPRRLTADAMVCLVLECNSWNPFLQPGLMASANPSAEPPWLLMTMPSRKYTSNRTFQMLLQVCEALLHPQ